MTLSKTTTSRTNQRSKGTQAANQRPILFLPVLLVTPMTRKRKRPIRVAYAGAVELAKAEEYPPQTLVGDSSGNGTLILISLGCRTKNGNRITRFYAVAFPILT